jgi:hypothetical protein
MNHPMIAGACVLASALTLTFAVPARAEKVPFHTPEQLKAKCDKVGGSYTPPNQNGVYMCEFDGAIGVCGGVGEHAKTCGVIMDRVATNPRLGQLRLKSLSGVLSATN